MTQTATITPFIIHPSTQLIDTHPQLISLSKQISIKRVHYLTVDDADLKLIGSQLWQALQIQNNLDQAKQKAGIQVLPIIIETDEPVLFSLPWESLYHPTEGFLSRNPNYTFSQQWKQTQTGLDGQLTGDTNTLVFKSPTGDNTAEAKKTVDSNIFTDIEPTEKYLGNEERVLLKRLTVYKTPVTEVGVKCIAEGLVDPIQTLQRLVNMGLVEKSDLNCQTTYQIISSTTEGLNSRDQLSLDIRKKAASFQQSIYDNEQTISQAIITHEALAFANQQLEADQFALTQIVDKLLQTDDDPQRILQDWLTPLQNSTDPNIQAMTYYYLGCTYQELKEYDEALEHYKQALSMSEQVDNMPYYCKSLNGIAHIDFIYHRHEDMFLCMEQALKITQQTNDKENEAYTLSKLSDFHFTLNNYEQAYNYAKATLSLTGQINDVGLKLGALERILESHYQQNQYAVVLNFVEQGILLAQEADNLFMKYHFLFSSCNVPNRTEDYYATISFFKQKLELVLQNNSELLASDMSLALGVLFNAQADDQTALQYLQQSYSTAQTQQDILAEGHALKQIGFIYYHQKDHETALQYLKKAQLAFQKTNAVARECQTLEAMINIYSEQQNYDALLMYLQQGLALVKNNAFLRADYESGFSAYIGYIYSGDQNYDKALEYLIEAQTIENELERDDIRDKYLRDIAEICLNQRDETTIFSYLKKTFFMAQEIAKDDTNQNILEKMGNAYYSYENTDDEALEYFTRILVIAQEVNNRHSEGTILRLIGNIYFARSVYDMALHYANQSLYIEQELGNHYRETISLWLIAGVYDMQDDLELALECLNKILNIAKQYHYPNVECDTLVLMGDAYYRRGFYTEASEALNQAIPLAEELEYTEKKYEILRLQNNINNAYK